MKTLNFDSKFALIHYQCAALENYNPEVINQDDDFDYLEEIMQDLHESGSFTENWTILTKNDKGEIIDYYTGNVFEMQTFAL